MENKEPKKTGGNETYSVPLAYYVKDVVDGKIVEREKKAEIQLSRLHRRSLPQSRLALKAMNAESSPEELALDFVEACVTDPKVKEELKGDILGCIDLFNSEPVVEDFKRFFENWGPYRKMQVSGQE